MAKKGSTIKTRSRIESDLPKELREEVHRLLIEDATYEDISLYCKAKGHDISRSSVGRYGKPFLQAYKKVLQFEDQSRILKSEVGEGLLLDEAISKLLMQKVMDALLDGEMDILQVPRLLSDVAKLQSSNIQREKAKVTFENEVRSRTLEEAADVVEKTARKHGMSKENAEMFRRDVLGIR